MYLSPQNGTSVTIWTAPIAATFLVFIVAFLMYDNFVQRRNANVIDAFARSNAVLSSLFPSNVAARLISSAGDVVPGAAESNTSGLSHGDRVTVKRFLDTNAKKAGNGGGTEQLGYEGEPIADLFPECTIMVSITVTC